GGGLDGLIDRGRLAVDQGVGIEPFHRVVLEPAHPQHAGGLGMRDLLGVGVQLDVVAHAAAEGAGGVLDGRQFHSSPSPYCYRRTSPSGPDETVNVQPSARPLQLPLMRRGMYRPVSTCSQAESSSGPGSSANWAAVACSRTSAWSRGPISC